MSNASSGLHSRCGYIAGDNTLSAGIQSFQSNARFFSAIHPAFWSIDNDTLTLGKVDAVYANSDIIKTAAQKNGTMIWPWIVGPQTHDRGKKLRDLLNNDATFRNNHENDLITKVLNDPNFKDSNGNNILAGIELDYEHLQDNVDPADLCNNADPSKQCPNVSGFHTFLVDLGKQVHNQGKQISDTVPAVSFRAPDPCFRSGHNCYAYHYPTLSGILDIIHVMCYDFHPCDGHIGPEAPKTWVSDTFDNIKSTNQPQKFVYIMPNYGNNSNGSTPTLTDAAKVPKP